MQQIAILKTRNQNSTNLLERIGIITRKTLIVTVFLIEQYFYQEIDLLRNELLKSSIYR